MLIREVLPMALGILLTPIGIVPPILLLFTAQPRLNAAAFLVGWMGGVFAGFLLATGAADVAAQEAPHAAVHWIRIGMGLLLLWLAFGRWRGRSAQPETPAWIQKLSGSTPGKSLRMGLLLTLANPKILLLSIAAGVATASAAPYAAKLVAALWFAAAASAVVAAPLLLYLLLGRRILPPLAAVRDWLIRHNSAILAVVLLVIGAVVLNKGLQGLA